MTLHAFQVGGCELQLLSLAKALKNHGVDLIILYSRVAGSVSYKSAGELEFFEIPRMLYKPRLIPLYLSYLFRWKLKSLPLLFHCHAISYFTEQILSFAQSKKVPTMVKVATGGDVTALKNRIGKIGFRTYAQVDRYLSINPSIQRELEDFPIAKGKIASIPNAVDPARFFPIGEREKVSLKESLGLPRQSRFITMVARFVERKRYEDLIRAWAEIAAKYPMHMLLLVGDGEERPNCEHLAEQLNIQDRVIFAGEQRDTARYFQVTDLFAFTSRLEGLPNVVLEAMSSELPILASAIPGVEEIIVPFRNGLLFPPLDVAAIVRSLTYLLAHPEEARKMGIAARKKILEEFSFEKIAPKFCALYEELAQQVKKMLHKEPPFQQ